MRIVFSPSLRIGAGLLLAALLSRVGYQVFLRKSYAPEALLKRADDLSWLNSWIAAEPIYRRPSPNSSGEGIDPERCTHA